MEVATQQVVRPDAETVHDRIAAKLNVLGWTRKELGLVMGRSAQTITTLMTGSYTGAAARRRLENSLGMAVWCDDQEFASRQKIIAFYKADPATLRRPQLNALVKKHRRAAGFPARIRPRSAAIVALENYALTSLKQ